MWMSIVDRSLLLLLLLANLLFFWGVFCFRRHSYAYIFNFILYFCPFFSVTNTVNSNYGFILHLHWKCHKENENTNCTKRTHTHAHTQTNSNKLKMLFLFVVLMEFFVLCGFFYVTQWKTPEIYRTQTFFELKFFGKYHEFFIFSVFPFPYQLNKLQLLRTYVRKFKKEWSHRGSFIRLDVVVNVIASSLLLRCFAFILWVLIT